jgi:Carboxypeptidase regulatory-like domain/TonB dependent receptor
VRLRFPLQPLLLTLFLTAAAFTQSPNGTISGLVLDVAGRAITGADVVILNDDTGIRYSGVTNDEGIYTLSNLPPAPYRIQVSKIGFKTLIKPDVVLNVQDALAINFTLPVGAIAETVTVEGGTSLVNTESGSVSTVVDRKFVENLPLNGRSFQDLILLTPGVVTNNPQTSVLSDTNGQFSVNGQRTESNYYSVDGVSANFGGTVGQPAVTANTGSLPASTILGTTQGLVSVDALEEFRVQSSSYSAEYGHSPGGQFDFVTRSGTNRWHGVAFEYFRNDIFDARDWFDGYFDQPKSPLRQNDFGGTLGGPVRIPGLYNGTDKTFFFFSYEGLRLIQPQPASISLVPTLELRQAAPAALQPVVNAFPLPNCPASASNCSNDLGDGLGQFVGAWSNPSAIDAYSIRVDHYIGQRLKVFFRYSNTPSSQTSRLGGSPSDPAVVFLTTANLGTSTLGLTSTLSSRITNEFRLNYSVFDGIDSSRMTAFEGSSATDFAQLHGLNGSQSDIAVGLYFSDFSEIAIADQFSRQGRQRQWNLTDAVSATYGTHQIKVGVDYRTLAPIQKPSTPDLFYEYLSEDSLIANSADYASAESTVPAYPRFLNFSAFGQDQWRVAPRLTLSLGVRWDVNPSPSAPTGNLPYTLQGSLNDPSALSLAPRGTPLWQTSWYNFAPRVGAAYMIRNAPGTETVVRGGTGVFFDTGQQLGAFGYNGAGFTGMASYCPSGCAGPSTFPLAPDQISPAIVNPPVGPGLLVYGFAPHLQLPFTLQWNTSVEQALGKAQALTVSYVGAAGRRLLQSNQFNLGSANPDIGTVLFIKNGLTSDYDALQTQLQRRMSHGLQALASYTWSHSIDYGSRNNAFPSQRGNSDFDIRQNLSAALSYELPGDFHRKFARLAVGHWGIDSRLSARTGFPVTLNGQSVTDPETLQRYFTGLDLVAGEAPYIYGSEFPGGKSINPSAFSLPAAGQIGDAPRNFVRGFGAWQTDFALRRDFPLHENLKLQFRAEAFNILNHPNFGTINPSYCPEGPSCTFGQATATLAQSLGGLSPLYQLGGARSMQFALRLVF